MGPIQVKGKDDVMSNFYECEINQDGKRFRCLEGVYQYRKLKEHGIGERERDPLMAMDGRATKARADALVPKRKINTEWLRNRQNTMMELLRMKANQCQIFADTLENTGDRRLEHPVGDVYWGLKVSLTGARWGENIFGKCLMELREERRRIQDKIEVRSQDGGYWAIPPVWESDGTSMVEERVVLREEEGSYWARGRMQQHSSKQEWNWLRKRGHTGPHHRVEMETVVDKRCAKVEAG
jgi:ribA/ribD-fused uncharacterized protein